MLIRPIEEPDWTTVLPLFRGIVEAGETYAYPEGIDDDAVRALWDEPPPGVTVVAVDEDGGEVLGTAKTGPNRPGRGAHVSTASFMVAPTARGQGVGRALGDWVLRWATDAGYDAMQFNAVVETNTAAVALWRSLGFEVVGTVPDAFESRAHGRVGLHVMHRRLGERRPDGDGTA